MGVDKKIANGLCCDHIYRMILISLPKQISSGNVVIILKITQAGMGNNRQAGKPIAQALRLSWFRVTITGQGDTCFDFLAGGYMEWQREKKERWNGWMTWNMKWGGLVVGSCIIRCMHTVFVCSWWVQVITSQHSSARRHCNKIFNNVTLHNQSNICQRVLKLI